MEDLHDELLRIISFLRERPLVLYSGAKDYYSCKIFLEGYFCGLDFNISIKLFDSIRIWLGERINEKLSISWTDYPTYFFPNENDAKKKEILLQVLEDFLKENNPIGAGMRGGQ